MKEKLFFTFNDFLQNQFGCRVYKVSVDGGFSCPNRDGTKGQNGCIFCDASGSSSKTVCHATSIKEQVLHNIKVRKRRFHAQKYIVYFQSFTNTYASCSILKSRYDEAVFAHPDIVGLAIGTRSDCIDEEKLSLIASYKKNLPFVTIEYGMQTIHNKTLKKIDRKETHEDFLKALELSRKYGIEPVVHVILGLPGETDQEMLQTALALNKLKIKGVKIHVLTAIKETPLAHLYEKRLFTPLSYEKYLGLVCDFLERLPKDCVIYRFAGGGHAKDILEPKWAYEKRNTIQQAIAEELKKRKSYQGSFWDLQKFVYRVPF